VEPGVVADNSTPPPTPTNPPSSSSPRDKILDAILRLVGNNIPRDWIFEFSWEQLRKIYNDALIGRDGEPDPHNDAADANPVEPAEVPVEPDAADDVPVIRPEEEKLVDRLWRDVTMVLSTNPDIWRGRYNDPDVKCSSDDFRLVAELMRANGRRLERGDFRDFVAAVVFGIIPPNARPELVDAVESKEEKSVGSYHRNDQVFDQVNDEADDWRGSLLSDWAELPDRDHARVPLAEFFPEIDDDAIQFDADDNFLLDSDVEPMLKPLTIYPLQPMFAETDDDDKCPLLLAIVRAQDEDPKLDVGLVDVLTNGLTVGMRSEPPHGRSYNLRLEGEQASEQLNYIQSMIDADVLVEIPEEDRGEIKMEMPLFFITEQHGLQPPKLRLITDARKLNERITDNRRLKYYDHDYFRRWAKKQKWAASVDLANAFWNIPLSHRLRRYCCCRINGTPYCFTRMFFGLSIAPVIMHRLGETIRRLVVIEGRRRGVPIELGDITRYADDFVIGGGTEEECQMRLNLFREVLEELQLGFNPDKVVHPTQRIHHLGAEWNLAAGTAKIETYNVATYRVRLLMALFKNRLKVTKRDVEVLIGRLTWTTRVNPRKLHYLYPLYAFLHGKNNRVDELPSAMNEDEVLMKPMIRRLIRLLATLSGTSFHNESVVYDPTPNEPVEIKRAIVFTDASIGQTGVIICYADTIDLNRVVGDMTRAVIVAQRIGAEFGEERPIYWYEGIAVVNAIAFLSELNVSRATIYCDNSVIVAPTKSGRARTLIGQAVLMMLEAANDDGHFYELKQIASELNPADIPSRCTLPVAQDLVMMSASDTKSTEFDTKQAKLLSVMLATALDFAALVWPSQLCRASNAIAYSNPFLTLSTWLFDGIVRSDPGDLGDQLNKSWTDWLSDEDWIWGGRDPPEEFKDDWLAMTIDQCLSNSAIDAVRSTKNDAARLRRERNLPATTWKKIASTIVTRSKMRYSKEERLMKIKEQEEERKFRTIMLRLQEKENLQFDEAG
jgi:hypothetical protein